MSGLRKIQSAPGNTVKPFYYPSRQKRLNPEQEMIALSPNRSSSKSDLNSSDQLFLRGTHLFYDQPKELKQSPKLDESWPSSERASSFSDDQFLPSRSDLSEYQNKKHSFDFSEESEVLTSDQKTESKGKSVLQRYIDRFRHGKPLSREERRQLGISETKDFWWLDSSPPTPSDSSTPKDEVKGRSRQHRPSFQEAHSKAEIRKSSDDEGREDEIITEMQKKADRLVEMSECSLGSSGPAVSTDGLGSTSSDVYSLQHHTLPQRPLHPTSHNAVTGERRVEPVIPSWTSGPEDDILYRWRLQRKLDTARKGIIKPQTLKPTKDADNMLEDFGQRLTRRVLQTGDTFTPRQVQQDRTKTLQVEVETQTTEDVILSGKDEMSEEQSKTKPFTVSQAVIASPVASQEKISSVDPHFHFMCDLLPCSHLPEYSDNRRQSHTQRNSRHADSSSEGEGDSVHGTKYKQYLQAEKPDSDRKKNFTEKDEKRLDQNHATQSQCDKSGRFHRHITEVKRRDCKQISNGKRKVHLNSSAEGLSSERQADVTFSEPEVERHRAVLLDSDTRIPKINLSSSPHLTAARINSAIGQVVEDHLFRRSDLTVVSSVDSWTSLSESRPQTTRQQTLESSVSNTDTPEKKPILDTDLNNVQYESDGEFSDDSLLQILRKQRSQFEEKLSKVDHLLSKRTTASQY